MEEEKGVIIHQPTYVHPSAKIGHGTKIGAFCDIGKDVKIGEECNIQCQVSISNDCVVGDRVFLGPKATLLNDNYMDGKIEPVVIEDDVRIGGGAIILPGVRVRRGALIGAGAVVTKDVRENATVYGNPARER